MADLWEELDDLEYDRKIAERNWNKLQDTHSVVGFKEGVSEAKELSLQKGFNQGFNEGALVGIEIGRLIGIS
ncbi:hypothetical protein HK096_006109, partial [Nowakowskiella sp. JEL0078]